LASKLGRGVAEFSAIGIGAAAAGAAFILTAPLWVLPLAAVGAWSTIRVLLIPAAPVVPDAPRPLSPNADYDASIAEVEQASRRIAALSDRARDPLVRERGLEISLALNRVIAHLREDPEDLRDSQKFLAVYIERTKYILSRYVQYENIATPQAESLRQKVRDELLPLLVELCKSQLQRITYDDIRSLETDVDVLRKAITLEGL